MCGWVWKERMAARGRYSGILPAVYGMSAVLLRGTPPPPRPSPSQGRRPPTTPWGMVTK